MTKQRLVRDTEILQALGEQWAYEETVSPGFERSDARLETAPSGSLKVATFAPASLYEALVFPLLRDKRDVQVWNVPFVTMRTYRRQPTIHPLHIAVHLFAVWWQITAYHLAIHVSSHRKMHHVADNSPIDISSTLFYQRDSLLGFLHYFFRFYFLGSFDMFSYFSAHNQRDRAFKSIAGEWGTLAVLGYITYHYNTMAMVWCFWVPLTASRFGMMSGNWVQHSFLDPKDPLGGGLHNSITILESRYNLLNYNDGYHASHHLNAQRHWSEHPREFLRRRSLYVDSDAIVLVGTDYDDVFGLLMSHSYDKLAAKMVDISGDPRAPHPKSIAERAAWLKERTKKSSWTELKEIYGLEVLNAKFGKKVVAAGLESCPLRHTVLKKAL
ncbi:hypothetical protein HK100_003920 [Physocladia obscura]|uniref:Fatty acid desaturase domain-containing protein n=1 Tax=Physocladia obscura TaxID=109957 RepID=A0AAD5SVQ6_9FUNG|nr:hypothetical protein HK100_003920 [Physocladia obscura]